MGTLDASEAPFWAPLGSPWAPFWFPWIPFGSPLASLGPLLGPPGFLLSSLGHLLDAPWTPLGSRWKKDTKSMKFGRTLGSCFGAPGHLKNFSKCVTLMNFGVLDALKTDAKKNVKKVMQAIQAGTLLAP